MGLSEPVIALVMLHLIMIGLSVQPITFTLSIWRYRLWEVDVWINRTFVFGGLTLLVTAVYILTVGFMSNLFQSGNSLALSVLATGLIAILFNPVRQRLQTAVNRLMYGERDDPITVLTALGKRLEETAVPSETLPALVETIAQTLRLPYVAVVGMGERGSRGAGEQESGGKGRVLAAYPSPHAQHSTPFAFSLIYQSETIGQLLVAPRVPGEAFNPAERRLLENVARQAGTAVYAAQLTNDLQRSRERLVTTREEERRRIRRDLHDGLGPQLATLSLKVDAARNYLTHDAESADHLLTELKSEIHSAISDIRRLVNDLRPPALDQLGLVSALREYVVRQNGSGGLQISLTAPDELPLLPAAVEVAAYRIALEAITNCVRHAQAHICQLCLQLDNGLQLEIRDDGAGLPVGYQAGVGLSSMRERTAELGGTFDIESIAGGGTMIMVQLPFSRDP
jgi:signal transduction histidine kinase